MGELTAIEILINPDDATIERARTVNARKYPPRYGRRRRESMVENLLPPPLRDAPTVSGGSG
jgi:hypothetical protein